MPWNPEKYNQFKDVRYKPFFDLADMINADNLSNGLDIGCGTGEQTMILAEKFPSAKFLGIDPSPEMLAKRTAAPAENPTFRLSTVEEFLSKNALQKWDLVFSNAALQWSDDHETLFPGLISLLGSDGQLAVQMPVQKENLLNEILLELVQEPPFSGYLQSWKRQSPMLGIDQYATIMFESGLKDIQIIQKVYPIIAETPDTLLDFIGGSALVPYMERLTTGQQEALLVSFKRRVEKAFHRFPAIYAFKRLLLYGRVR